MTRLRLWIVLKILGLPDKHCKVEAHRLYEEIWPKNESTMDDTIRTISLFMMRQRINERFEHCLQKRYRMW
jgi:hypothetical protein